MYDANPSLMWGRILVDELVRAGLTHVCISPGSRSTPLTLAAAQHDDVQVHNHIDERSAGFFALGCAKITGTPAALICTSGSALAHYLPALIEAAHSRIPLIVLSADRPVELMNTGAGQTIDQKKIFGSYVRAFAHLETPDLNPQALRRLRVTAQRMYATSLGQAGTPSLPGPVHFNVPFKEPLAPLESSQEEIVALSDAHPEEVFGRAEQAPWMLQTRGQHAPHQHTISRLAELCAGATRGVIVCGPLEPIGLIDAMRELLDATGFVLMADPLSHVRYGLPHDAQLTTYDAFLRARDLVDGADYKPDVILRFGAQPTSKAYRFWREAHPDAHTILVDAHAQAYDHPQLAREVVCAEPVACAHALAGALRDRPASAAITVQRGRWLAQWQRLHRIAHAAITAQEAPQLWEGQIARDVLAHTRPHTILFVASSMPVRDLDACAITCDVRHTVVANRGANGIDGLIATAAGVSAASGQRVRLLIGDVAFLHDASSLLTALRGVDPATPLHLDIVVVNNAGGGIFSYLPIAAFPAHFERHFTTPHQADVKMISKAYGADFVRVESPGSWLEACESWEDSHVERTHHVHVTEVIVDRESNVSTHRSMWGHIIHALNAPDEA